MTTSASESSHARAPAAGSRRGPRRPRRTRSGWPELRRRLRCRRAGSTAGTRCRARRTARARPGWTGTPARTGSAPTRAGRRGPPAPASDLVGVGVGDAGHPDDALVEQVADRADRLGVRHVGVGPVELVEPDRVDAEPLRADALRGLLEVLRARRSSVHDPSPGRRCPPLVATRTSDVSPPQDARALAMSASLWPTSSASRW